MLMFVLETGYRYESILMSVCIPQDISFHERGNAFFLVSFLSLMLKTRHTSGEKGRILSDIETG